VPAPPTRPTLTRPGTRLAGLVLAALALTATVQAQTSEPIRYTLRFPAPHTHYVEVDASVPTAGQSEVELMMAVWTPGSYLIREYARNVEGVSARTPGGTAVAVSKSRKNRWRVQTSGEETIVVSYRVYSREMSVRTNWVEDSFGLLNGAQTFVTLAGAHDRPHEVLLELPATWTRSMTALPPTRDGQPHSYRAASFDHLVDSPIVVGNPAVYEFDVAGKTHALVDIGEGGVWDGARAAADVEAIVEEHYRMWGELPYERYLFLNVITEADGAIEHLDSTVIMTSRWRMRDRERYLDWLSTVSHEFFHVWNVKRLRPVELGPFDYEKEAHTSSLWVSEGVTAYYGPLLVHRAGLSTREEYLGDLSDEIRTLQTTPGRFVQPVAEASYDAWIKYYRRNENSTNATISYYTKGALIGFLLDARIRRLTDGEKSLDDLMRVAYDRYSGERGFTPHEFQATASEVAGSDLRGWFHHALETVEELDYTEAQGWLGLEITDPGPMTPSEDGEDPGAWLGLAVTNDAGRLVVTGVRRETPGFAAGLNVGDEILAIDGYRVGPADWDRRLGLRRAGETATLLVARRERLTELGVTFAAPPAPAWELSASDKARADQTAHLEAWLGAR
jgi:predicted metalloprotease with PDZ domain